LDEDEVKELLSENFEALKCSSHKNNSLSVAKEQNLDGVGLINLAGSGSLYLKLSPKNVSESPAVTASTSTSSNRTDSATDSVKKTLEKANDILEKLRVSILSQ
jgi:hypothetical protein